MLPHFKWPLRTMFWHATARRRPAKSHTERTDAVRLGEIVMPILGKLVPVDTQTMERSMHIPQERPWPTIDLAELRFGIAFGSSVEELADFLQRDVEDVRQKWAAEVQRSSEASDDPSETYETVSCPACRQTSSIR